MSSGPEVQDPSRTLSLSRRRWVLGRAPTVGARRGVVTGAVAAIAVVGVVDHLTGPVLSVAPFYLLPVGLVAVAAGRRAALGCAVLAGVSDVISDVVLVQGPGHRAVEAWNAFVLLIMLILVTELIDRIVSRARAALDAEARGREFLAMAAHQLRTPVAGMRSSVEALLMAEPDPRTQQSLLSGLCHQLDRTSRRVTSLLRMARLDQHEPLSLRRVDLVRLAEDAVSNVSMLASDLSWGVTGPEVGEIMAAGDADALTEALTNLLDNARRHAHTTISVVVAQVDGAAVLTVSDDGPGLSPGGVEPAFERFVSLDGRGGTGLGLPIARAIAETHGGTLEYHAGAFVLRIPIAPADGEARPEAPSGTGPSPRPATPSPRRR